MDFPLLTREPTPVKTPPVPRAPAMPAQAEAVAPAVAWPSPAAEWQTCLRACTTARDWEDSLLDVLMRIQSRLGAYRVSVGWARAGGCHLVAWTDVAPLDEGVGVQELEAACAEALGWRQGQLWPQPVGAAAAEFEAEAHQALFRSQGLTALLSAPLRDDDGQARGVVVCERIPLVQGQAWATRDDEAADAHAFTAEDLKWLEQLLGVIGPVLAMRHRLELPWYMRGWGQMSRLAQRLSDPRERWLRGAVLSFFGVAAFLFGWPLGYTVSAQARLEPQSESVLVAPTDALVQQTQFRVGDVVRSGQVLGKLLPPPAAAASGAAPAPLTVTAPFDGVILSRGANSQAGRAVQAGDTLWVMAPGLDWRVVLQLEERDVARVQPGQRAVLRLAGTPERSLNLVVGKVAPVIVEGERHARYEVQAQVTGGTVAGLRPGLHGVAQIDMPPKPMLQRAWDAVRRAWYLGAWGLW